MRDRPLTGIRVLDLTNVLAGPYCSYQLALLGAEVIKVETPNAGDLARQLGADPELNALGLGASFLAQNAGKKSVTVDLKSEQGKANFTKLVEDSDVLVENFRPGVLARLGFPWSHLQQLNPRLVYCAISGFGQTGPMSQRPAYDQIIQGLSGMMSITGTPETAPLRVGFPVCDTIGGLAAAMAINAALVGRARTGRGHFIDVSMLEASLSAMGWVVSNYLIAGRLTQPMGDQNFTAAPSGTFQAADGPLNIAANRQEQYVTLCRILEREDLIDDERFRDREARKANREALNEELNAALRTRRRGVGGAVVGCRGARGAHSDRRQSARSGTAGRAWLHHGAGDARWAATHARGGRQRRSLRRRTSRTDAAATTARRAQRRGLVVHSGWYGFGRP